MIHELLFYGQENAQTGRQLATILDTDIRIITKLIESERREGQPICATSSGEHAGYFLGTEDDLQKYCGRLYHRAGELFKTRRALLNILKQVEAQKEAADASTKRLQE